MKGHRRTDGALLIRRYILIHKERLNVAICLCQAAVTALVHGLTAVSCISCCDLMEFAVSLKSAQFIALSLQQFQRRGAAAPKYAVMLTT